MKSGAGMVRFLDRVLCDGNMPEAIEQAVEATAKNLRTPTLVSGAGAKTDTEIPREVLREVIANAVIHREYGDFFLGESVSVDIYPDRVEVSSPGGLWGGVTPDTIGNGESRCQRHAYPVAPPGAV
ncbi:ATP-binding protein [Bifidobacterium subtile]|uniref:ATP-binding protein n=1 Tax=Bifidobacterium subtile TaxID=77635 RepID=UPI001D02F107|nr:ATP-binding protein [Bifidobacterium subtile]